MTTQPIEPLLEEGFKDYVDGPDVSSFERLTKQEALTLLQRCEVRGLMHSVWTFLTPFIGAICNCNVESGCMAMKLTVGYSMPMMWRGESVARLDTDDVHVMPAMRRALPVRRLVCRWERTRRSVTLDATEVLGMRYLPKCLQDRCALARGQTDGARGRCSLVGERLRPTFASPPGPWRVREST